MTLIERLKLVEGLLNTETYAAYAQSVTEAIAALEAMQWVKCSERMPEIDYSKPEYLRHVDVIATDGAQVRQLKYKSQGFAATEKGKLARFEELAGRLAWITPTHWMPLPAPPTDNAKE